MRLPLLLQCLFIFSISSVFAQKPAIDTSVLGKWPSLAYPTISCNGKYVSYVINNQPVNNKTLVYQSFTGKWKKEISGISKYLAEIDSEGKYGIYLNNDTLNMLKLGTSEIKKIADISSFKLSNSTSCNLVAYHKNSIDRELIVQNLSTGRQLSYKDVADYLISPDGRSLVVKTDLKNASLQSQSLKWVSLPDGKIVQLWNGRGIEHFIVDAQGNQVSFIVKKDNESNLLAKHSKSIWYFKSGMKAAILLAEKISPGIDLDMTIESIDRFSNDASSIFLNLKEQRVQNEKTSTKSASIDIWSYTDTKLQSLQLSELQNSRTYKAVISIPEKKIIQIEKQYEIIQYDGIKEASDNLILVRSPKKDIDPSELSWNKQGLASYYLVSTKDGIRKCILNNIHSDAKISPQNNYVLYFNQTLNSYFSYNTTTENIVNITKEIQTEWTPYLIGRWTRQDKFVLIYDRYDIWKVDLKGEEKPTNLTNSFGRKNKIVFRIASHQPNDLVDLKEKLIVSGFNNATKQNGFYSIDLKKIDDPLQLTMGSHMYYAPGNENSNGLAPLKAKNTNSFILQRMSATQFPNLISTKDFKNFNQLSYLSPEKHYNWLTTELVAWQTFSGDTMQGILYKPENFDSTKKYPVIFQIYQNKSQLLNEYLTPRFSTSDINIPWFVSQGYLVFTPDMRHQENIIGRVGESAVEIVLSAAKYLETFSWVDQTKIGLQGFSFGGYEANYIVTHTNIFAAALTGGGPIDLVSLHGSIFDNGNGGSWQSGVEIGQLQLGTTPWQDPLAYVKNSPIFYVHKITTPLLLLFNKKDGATDFRQGIEFFTALRRLGKRAWMLQYDNGSHGVHGKDAIDYTIRITQFFNHYLKGKAAPTWILKGIPATSKGQETGFELDTTGLIPQDSPLIRHD